MKLLGYWDAGPYIYQVWEVGGEFFCTCLDTGIHKTVFVGEGDTPLEAITDGIREALRVLS